MDEEGLEHPTSLVTNTDREIAQDIEFLAGLEHQINIIKNRLVIVDSLTEKRRPWWHR